MKVVEGVNLGVRFLCELGAVAAIAYWGYKTGSGAAKSVLAIAAPAAVIVVWALFVSPRPTIEVARPVAFAIELCVWAAAAAALWAIGYGNLAVAFTVVAVVSGALNWAWD